MARLLLLYRSQRLFDLRHQREDAGQRLRESDAVFQGQVVIVPHRCKRGELAGKSWSPVIALHGSHDAPQRPRLGGNFWRNRRSHDKARHQRLFRSQEVHHLGPDTDLGGNSGTHTFEPPVNTEQVRLFLDSKSARRNSGSQAVTSETATRGTASLLAWTFTSSIKLVCDELTAAVRHRSSS